MGSKSVKFKYWRSKWAEWIDINGGNLFSVMKVTLESALSVSLSVKLFKKHHKSTLESALSVCM